MKEILIIHTGGTIGSASKKEHRQMTTDTVKKAKRLLLENFKNSRSKYSCYADMFQDANLDEARTTLSESMTPQKLSEVINHLNGFDFDSYAGVIVLHGTDTLAFSASLFGFIYSNIKVPVVFVSGNRPPSHEASNANVNFKTAVELIWEGLSPNVYTVYRNSDNIVRLYIASTLMQCPDFSEDFSSASEKTVCELFNCMDKEIFQCQNDVFEKCKALSDKRNGCERVLPNPVEFKNKVLLVYPYTGLDYSVYSGCTDVYSGVVHSTYHSGTVSLPGIVNMDKAQMTSEYSVLYLSKLCEDAKLPFYIAPSKLGNEQYETMTVVSEKSRAVLLNMTTEAAYTKLTAALLYGFNTEALDEYMRKDVCGEILD